MLFRVEVAVFIAGVLTYGVFDLVSTNIVFNAAGTFTEQNILAAGIYLAYGFVPLILFKVKAALVSEHLV